MTRFSQCKELPSSPSATSSPPTCAVSSRSPWFSACVLSASLILPRTDLLLNRPRQRKARREESSSSTPPQAPFPVTASTLRASKTRSLSTSSTLRRRSSRLFSPVRFPGAFFFRPSMFGADLALALFHRLHHPRYQGSRMGLTRGRRAQDCYRQGSLRTQDPRRS